MMLSLWLIIGIAAAGAVSLTVSGVVIAVHLERRRNRKWMKDNNINRSVSQYHHSPHLSITDVDFNSLPRPVSILQTSLQRPRSESRFYASRSSEEDNKGLPEGLYMDSIVEPGHAGIGPAPQWLSPSKGCKRKKKIPKLVISGPPMMSRLSAVTELSEDARQGTPEPVELPTNRTPSATPEKEPHPYANGKTPTVMIVHDHQCSISGIITTPAAELMYQSNDQISRDAIGRARSTSAASVVTPLNIPLPELPDHSYGTDQRTQSIVKSLSSDYEKHQEQSLIMSPSSAKTHIDQFNRTSMLSRFDFGLPENRTRSSPHAPKLSIDTKTIMIQQIVPSQPLRPKSSGNNTPSGEFEVIDASEWNIPRGLKHLILASKYNNHYSKSTDRMQPTADTRKSQNARNSSRASTMRYPSEIARPSSITSIDMFRLSAISPSSPNTTQKGHKRQNCVRIKNLPPAELNKRPSSQLTKLTETEEDSSMLLPSPAKKDLDEVSQFRKETSKIPDISPQVSLRSKQVGLAPKRNAIGQRMRSVGDSPPSAMGTPAMKAPEYPTQTVGTIIRPLQLTSTNLSINVIKLPQIDFSPASQSFTFESGSPQRQKSKIQGPRSIPPTSLRVRNQTQGGPVRRKSSKRAAREASLRKLTTYRNNLSANSSSIDMLEANTMQSSPPISASSNQWSPDRRRRSNTIADHTSQGPPNSPLRTNSRSKTQIQTPPSFLNMPPPTTHKPVHSPSAISIWEDASVHGDSPEIDLPLRLSRLSQSSSRRTSRQQQPPSLSLSPTKSKQVASELIARFEGIENSHRGSHIRSDDELRDGRKRRSQMTVAANTAPREEVGVGYGLGLRF